MLENIGGGSLHDVDVILSEFEGSLLEVHVARRRGDNEAEVDVNDVSEHIH